jgi:hypothetical protein
MYLLDYEIKKRYNHLNYLFLTKNIFTLIKERDKVEASKIIT